MDQYLSNVDCPFHGKSQTFVHSLGEGIALVMRLKNTIAAGEIASKNITTFAVASKNHASTPIE